jgi:hypothetical protein
MKQELALVGPQHRRPTEDIDKLLLMAVAMQQGGLSAWPEDREIHAKPCNAKKSPS